MLPFNLPELEVSGLALVTSIDDCPPIASGEGSVVTARFVTREVHVVASVDVLGADGSVETITGTTIHPVWSVDRQEWVPLSELSEDETLQGLDGLVVVLSVTLSRVTQPVYNIEVHGEHVYQVGELGLVVHNACAGFNSEMTKALQWLQQHGFNAKNAVPYASRSSDKWMKGLVNGLKDGKVGYRIEWDPKIGGHINVFSGKTIGPHFTFGGNLADVEAILRQLF
jgi:hypothetical protein